MSSEVEIRAPAEQTEGTRSQILRWLKSVGDTVAENEPLIEIETDKVTVEVASPGSGTLREIVKQEQEEIGPGDLLGRIEAAGVGVAAGPSKSSDELAARSGAAFGDRAAQNDGKATIAHADYGSPNAYQASVADASAPAPAARNLSPAVRRLLGERGLDASQVRGTGQGGRITVEDVLAHGAKGGSTVATGASGVAAGDSGVGAGGSGVGAGGSGVAADRSAQGTASDAGPAIQTRGTAPDGAAKSGNGSGSHLGVAAAPDASGASAVGPSHRVPHTATRKRIAEHMVQSLLHTAPHVTTVFEADLTAVLQHRQLNKEEFARRGAPLTLTAYFLQATVAAIRAVPEANSRWTDTALEIFDSMHIGVATALETGLVVPVLRDVQSRDLFETAKGLEDLVSRARDGRLAPTDVRGGTFTISNHGVSGSLVATPIIINQPQAAILGIGKLEKRPVVFSDADGGEDRIVIRPRCYVTLTIDHRVMDGHQANRFLQTFVGRLATSAG
jgi:2-oxoglutarate dehydrogenase E2 component (dihydrolipoamide succinyltransferase)